MAGSDGGWQIQRAGNAQLLVAPRSSPHEAYARRRNIEERSQQADDCLVCLAVRGCRGRPDQEPTVSDIQYFVVARAWLDADGQYQLVAEPSYTGPVRRHHRSFYRSPMNSLTRAPSAISANIGEMSKPPIGGMIRRNGRNSGSVSAYTIATAGL